MTTGSNTPFTSELPRNGGLNVYNSLAVTAGTGVVLQCGADGAMHSYIEELIKFENAMDDAVVHLREQQSLMEDLDSPRNRAALLCLLSNGLRMYGWLEDHQLAIAEKIGEFSPLRRGGR